MTCHRVSTKGSKTQESKWATLNTHKNMYICIYMGDKVHINKYKKEI